MKIVMSLRRSLLGTAMSLLMGGGIAVCFAPAVSAGSEPGIPFPAPITVKELKRMDAEQLEQLFARGQIHALPVGKAQGSVLLRTDAKLPRMRAKTSGLVWKGKYFEQDGEFINQWLGFKAISSQAVIGTSAYDGRPSIVIEYPTGTAVFGNTRDELREIAPGIFLGRFYERCPCLKLQGYFVLEVKPCGCCAK